MIDWPESGDYKSSFCFPALIGRFRGHNMHQLGKPRRSMPFFHGWFSFIVPLSGTSTVRGGKEFAILLAIVHCCQLSRQQQCMSRGRQRERYHRQTGWQATDSAPHLCGSEGNKSKNQVWRVVSDPLPRWLAWEWQDNVIFQANPFSYQLTRLPRMELWFGIGLKSGFVLGWAGTNQFPILKPALSVYSFL